MEAAQIGRILAGDTLEFENLVREYQSQVFRVLMRWVQNPEVAEDLSQETFVKVYNNLHTFEGRSSLRSWILQIAVNTMKNSLRKHNPQTTSLDKVRLAGLADPSVGLEDGELATLLADAVAALPEKQKVAVTLRVFEDFSFQEVAEAMECPYDTAKANYRHGLMKLKEKLKGCQDLRDRYFAEPPAEVQFFGYEVESEA